MYLHVLGSSGSYPVPGRPGSGFVVEHGDTRVWCDAGPGTYPAIADLFDLELVSAVVISHQHPDHCLDALSVFHRWGYGEPGRRQVPLIAPRAVIDRLVAFLDADPGHRFFEVFDVDMVEDGDERSIGALTVAFAGTRHSVPTLASRWSDGSRVMAYSADTGPGGDWARIADGAHLFVCEATYREDEEQPYPFHLTGSEAGRIARERGSDRLMLTHIPAHLDAPSMVADAEMTFDRPVSLAVPGTRHKV